MKYADVDPIIREWANRHDLHLYEEHYDEEVRAAHINDTQGRTYRIGIEPPDSDGRIKVRACAWDFKKRNKLYSVTKDELHDTLEEVIEQINIWMKN